MNKLARPTDLLRHTWRRIPVALFSLGAALIFASCEREVVEGKYSGEPFVVKFSVTADDYDGEEAAARGYNTASSGPETVAIPFQEGGDLYMFATLEADPVPATRANVPLSVGALIRIMAFKQGSQYPDVTAEYEVLTDGDLRKRSGLDNYQEGDYRFVAYTYNSASQIPTYNSGLTETIVEPPHDLIVGVREQHISPSKPDISIPLKHRYSRLKVIVNTEQYNGANNKVRNAPTALIDPGFSAEMNYKTTNFSKLNLTSAQLINTPNWAGLGTSEVTSPTIIVFTNENPVTTILLGSFFMVNGHSLVPPTARFVKKLYPGISYTLKVRIKQTQWALSNIYWNEGKKAIMFDAEKVDNDEDKLKQQKRGIYFKWGSLIGVWPYQVGGSNVFNPLHSLLYMPNPNVNDAWGLITTTAGQQSGAFPGNQWTDISYIADNVTSSDRKNRYVTEHPDFGKRTGDICRYLSGKTYTPPGNWRLPTSEEYGTDLTSAWQENKEWFPVAGSISGIPFRVDAGMELIHIGGHYHDMFFPAAGYRDAAGTRTGVESMQAYWTSSAAPDASKAYCVFNLSGTTGNIHPDFQIDRNSALSVRCIRMLPGEQ